MDIFWDFLKVLLIGFGIASPLLFTEVLVRCVSLWHRPKV